MLADLPLDAPRWSGEGPALTRESLNDLLGWATAIEASDIRLQTGKRIILQVHGRVRKLGERRLTENEVEEAANALRGADAMAQIKSAQDFDTAYEIKPDRKTRLRFRVNGKGAYARGVDGAALVIRTMPLATWPLSRQHVDPRLAASLFPRDGIVLVAGATGTGKTRLLGGVTRGILEDPNSHRLITELSAPIENIYDDIDSPASEITQVEIGRNLPSFGAGLRNLMRSACNVAIVGECRDAETMTAAIDAALTNHAVYATTHAGTLGETIQRAVSLCPDSQRTAMTIALAQSLRLVVNQRLVWSVDGKRTPVREFLTFDRASRRKLAATSPDEWPRLVEILAEEQGTTFADSIRAAHAEGRISEEIAEKELASVA
ncbi:type IV pilus twitching motility protein PilT [Belnapia rosea]|uniref:type IV pilus twitching motility protein PilT n=1 Tax=Belnapia rosea TaxID=938405 RepID=UPI0008853E80|nr:ATPase, T2SS/T4P/T4SS family [Belnapia rosea]SDB71530.1 defect in organelle trafficking protein DotB [Belnapia rosea]